jgi:hypothetical protein
VEALDADGARISTPVGVSVDLATGGGLLGGPRTAEAVGGVASFDSLTITGAGPHILRMSADGFAPALAPAVVVRWEPGSVVITNATVLPMDREGALPRTTVVVKDGLIAAMGSDGSVSMPSDARVIDGTGTWVMPGIVDFHTHPRPFADWPDDLDGNGIMYLANGITSIVAMGDVVGLSDTRTRVEDGELVGPNVYAGKFARGPGDGGNPAWIVRNAAEARALVQRAQEDGYDFIKVYDQLSSESFAALAEEAGARGLPVIGHVVAPVGWKASVDKGQVMFAHASSFYAYAFGGSNAPERIPAVAAQVLASGAVVGTTLLANWTTVQYSLDVLRGLDPWIGVSSRPGVQYMDDRAMPQWQRLLQARPEARTAADGTAALTFIQRYLKAFHEAGVPLILGTDDIGVPGIVPGFALQEEIQLLMEGGVAVPDILAMGTRAPGAFIRAHMKPTDRVGTLELGARADLLWLSEDPRIDPGTLSSPRAVMVGGRWYDGGWLRDRLEHLRTAR